jgi:uncharacterized RDD family membrane protein YckC
MTSDAGRQTGLGPPPEGPGARASFGARALAYLVDAAASWLIAGLFLHRLDDPRRGLVVSAVFALEYLLLGTTTGQTLGMRLARIRIARVAAPEAAPGFLPVAVRTALLVLFLPAVVVDRDGRGLHDRAAGTVVVRV